LPEYPILPVFHSLEEKFSEWIERRFTGQAIINVLVVRICFKPEFIGIVNENPAKHEKSENESKGRFIQVIY
jgi:hypothetical protein